MRRYRLGAGLSQELLAERARMSTNGIGALERGYRRTPQRETLALLAGALSLDTEQRRAFEAAAARSAPPRRITGTAIASDGGAPARGAFLPLALSSFVGREAELEEIVQLVRAHRLVTLTGAGGIGKTQTALQAGNRFADAKSGVCFVSLAAVGSSSSVLSAIAAAADVQESSNRSLLDSLIGSLKHRSILLILDNCEHVIAEAARLVDALLGGCPNVRILATSREPLKAPGERSYTLPSLRVPASVTLFIDRARAIDHRFTLTAENAPVVGELCRRLDGIPLAIELAAARTKVLSPQQLVHRLNERFRVLTGGERTALPRHQTMRALIDWSYDLLSEPERALFRKLSVFAGGFTLESASIICDESGDEFAVLDTLASLVDKSLVEADPTGDARYRLLESTRQYAREKLAAAREQDAMLRRHAETFAELAERLERAYDSTPDREWFAAAEPELENWRAALEWSLEARQDVVLGQRLAGALRQAWVLRAAEGRRWVGAALESVDARSPADVVARLELAEALFDSALVQHKACAVSAERALAYYAQLDDRRGTAFAQRFLGRAFVFLGRRSEGESLLREALTAFRALGLRKMVGAVLEDIGVALLQRPVELDEARGAFAEALGAFKESEAERSAANVAINLAELEFRAGDAAKALSLAAEALSVDRETNFTLKVAHDLSNMSAYALALERFEEARALAREALALARGVGVEVVVAWALLHLAAVAALRPAPDLEGAHGDRARAARLVAYVDGQFAALDAVLEYTEQQEHDKLRAAVIAALDANELAAVTAEGRAWNEERAVSEALLV